MRRRRGSFPILPFLGRPQEFYIIRSDRIYRNLQHIYKLWRHPGQVNRHVLSFQAPPRNIRSTETVYCKQLMCHKTSHRRHLGQANRHVLSFLGGSRGEVEVNRKIMSCLRCPKLRGGFWKCPENRAFLQRMLR